MEAQILAQVCPTVGSMRIGISILTREGYNLWSNGIEQNVYHLACLLRSLAFVEKVILLDCGELCRPPDFAGELGNQFEIIPLVQSHDLIDVAIEVSGGLNVEWTAHFRALGGKVVFHSCGACYTDLVEPTIFNQHGFFSNTERCDEVWILEKDLHFVNMLKSLYRCPVYEVPYLWSPIFLENIAELVMKEGNTFGYKPGSLADGLFEPAIFEPNISVVKTGIVPFLICEQVERSYPGLINKVHFMNSAQFFENNSFVSLVGHSNLYKSGKTLLKNRDYFGKVVADGANLVVSHQIMCSQNYLYLDALYGDYPLIHNSPLFADVGYYYPESDIEAGVKQMHLALTKHDQHLPFYRQNAKSKIDLLSPYRVDNQEVYARRLLDLTSLKKI